MFDLSTFPLIFIILSDSLKSTISPIYIYINIYRLKGTSIKTNIVHQASFIFSANIPNVKQSNIVVAGYTDWLVVTDLEHQFVFPNEITLTANVKISSFGSLMQVFLVELTILFEENID